VPPWLISSQISRTTIDTTRRGLPFGKNTAAHLNGGISQRRSPFSDLFFDHEEHEVHEAVGKEFNGHLIRVWIQIDFFPPASCSSW
jgi:hypothetical protein